MKKPDMKNMKKRHIVIGMVAFLVVMIALVVGIYLFTEGNQNKSPIGDFPEPNPHIQLG